MLLLTNEDVNQLLTMPECIESLEQMYHDFAHGKALLSRRVDNISPNSFPDAYYAFKHMGGTWPAVGVQALRLNSDVVTHPVTVGKARRVKQHDAGTLAAGKSADFIVLNANPLEDITNTRRIASVYLRGKAINRNILNQ